MKYVGGICGPAWRPVPQAAGSAGKYILQQFTRLLTAVFDGLQRFLEYLTSAPQLPQLAEFAGTPMI